MSLAGAGHIGVAFEKVAQGLDARDILTATARNLGLLAIGSTGDDVIYDPLRHEDCGGGLLPGDSATVVDIGWSRGDDVVVRCRVKGRPTDV